MHRSNLRLDIQGLRALAVTLVIIFHFLPATLPGGYVGVDVFFVISGFLITAHLMREIDASGTIKIVRFWGRRVRRLIPAALLVLLVSIAVVLLVFPRTAWTQNLTEIGFAGFYILNWRLAGDAVDYFAADNPASIVQHYWSLSVEEQFYLVWPVLLLAAIVLGAILKLKSRRTAVLALLAIVFIASLSASIVITAQSQPTGYFITTTRAWEFALGGLIAFLPALKFANGRLHAMLSWAGLSVVLACAVLFGPETQFPGSIALIPVVATAALIWLGDSNSTWSPQYFAAAGPIQYLGGVSYAAYLWHWPLLMIYIELRGWAPGLAGAIGLGIVTVILATATKYLVEDPIRQYRGRFAGSLPTFSILAVGMACVLAMTAVPIKVLQDKNDQFQSTIATGLSDPTSCFGANSIVNNCDSPYAYSSTVNPEATQADSIKESLNMDECVRWGENLSEASCVHPGDPGEKTVLLYGDSHAGHINFAVEGAAKERGWEMREESRSACSGFELPDPNNTSEDYAECLLWSEQMTAQIIADSSIDIVVVSVRTATKPNVPNRASEAIGEFIASGKQVLVVREAPGAPADIPPSGPYPSAPECVTQAGEVDDPCVWNPPAWDEWILEAASDNNVAVADLRDIVCADGTCHSVIGGTIVYEDTAHFSATFSKSLANWMGLQLDSLVANRI